MEFLKIVSDTNDSLTNELQQQYTENGEQVYDGHDLDFDINDRGQNTCIKCDLRIYENEKHMLYPCNDTNVCLVCITDLQESHPQPNCPNQDCGQVFTKVLKLKIRKKQNEVTVIKYLPKNFGNIIKWWIKNAFDTKEELW